MPTTQPTLQTLVTTATTQDNPIDALRAFLASEEALEKSKQILEGPFSS